MIYNYKFDVKMIKTKSHVYVVPQTAESDQLIYILINFIFIFIDFKIKHKTNEET